jgi:hypothetical protein
MLQFFTMKYINPRNDGLTVKVREGEFPKEKEIVLTFYNKDNEVVHTEQCEHRHLFGVLVGCQDY